jgi:hypothetical protein
MSESDFDSAWRAFADADTRLRAPDRIRDAVLAEWDAPCEVRHRVRSHRAQVAGAMLAVAATLALAVGLFRVPGSGFGVHDRAFEVPRPRVPSSGVSNSLGRPEVPTRAAGLVDSGPRSAPLPARRRTRVARDVVPTETSSTGGSAAVVALTGEPALAAEPLQLVRLRVPRTSLRAFGVALIDPDASGLVDVDLIVGSDGLPRDIRRVRPVVDVRDQSMESP